MKKDLLKEKYKELQCRIRENDKIIYDLQQQIIRLEDHIFLCEQNREFYGKKEEELSSLLEKVED
jgi:hypothetical protein